MLVSTDNSLTLVKQSRQGTQKALAAYRKALAPKSV
jgi:hypothetical protein